MFVCVAAEARPPAHPGVSAREAASVVVGEAGVAQEWVLGTMKMRIVYIQMALLMVPFSIFTFSKYLSPGGSLGPHW